MAFSQCLCCEKDAVDDGEIVAAVPSTPAGTSASPRRNKFRVELDRRGGTRLGISVVEAGRLLQIIRVVEGNTAASNWNAEHPDALIQEGDFLISVDGKTVHDEIKAGCQQWRVLDVEVKRESVEERKRRELRSANLASEGEVHDTAGS
uniref:PDZ domain-containing protein n=1 Tax=Noctiluca scintillans TaxID=2966 RepID=A0A7S1EWQ1_NOCSC|mmetsp:Transcript_1337/g.3609  ORF Transcript_1337/g.3609 Transcript_1337/m.3609 type:complete len:149 (+) Transcript_1337:66-512(+)